MSVVFLSLGSNIGDKKNNLKKTIETISTYSDITLIASSSFYETPPVGYEKQDKFLNCVVKIKTSLDVFLLLDILQKTEKKIGRKETFKWGPRVIDIDILFYDNVIINKDNLVVPHPHLHNRGFVLLPFAEIDKDFIHPVLNCSIGEILLNLPENEVKSIVKLQ